MINLNKKKRLVITLLLLSFVMCIIVGTTYAYMKTATREIENVFTGSENIRAKLREPNWDPAEGLKLVPGKTVHKDPMITNTGQVSEYAAIRLTFQNGDKTPVPNTDLLRLLNLIEISWSDKWVICSGSITIDEGSGKVTAISQPIVFYYNGSLAPGKVSDPVFNSIRVKDKRDGLTEADLRWLQGIEIIDGKIVKDPAGLQRFYIKVEGAAVQTEGFAGPADAADTLKAMFP